MCSFSSCDCWTLVFEENEVTVIVNSDQHVNMFEEIFPSTIWWIGFRGHLLPKGWSNSTHLKSINGYFEESFPGTPYLNNRQFREPDYVPSDFLKKLNHIFVNCPKSLCDLKDIIWAKIPNVLTALLVMRPEIDLYGQ